MTHQLMFLWKCWSFRDKNVSTWGELDCYIPLRKYMVRLYDKLSYSPVYSDNDLLFYYISLTFSGKTIRLWASSAFVARQAVTCM